mmetsp:Transcript_15789/g.20629  ORF Transcript_15789/g.20629 Transcript_15789/m.20629 type:complete len:350 (-) Transcript_15789:525-1574(-)
MKVLSPISLTSSVVDGGGFSIRCRRWLLKLVYVYAVFLLFVYYYVYRYYFSLHSRRSVIERTLIENILFSGDAGEMERSIDEGGMRWITESDEFLRSVLSQSELVSGKYPEFLVTTVRQRYALATLYFATDGQKWRKNNQNTKGSSGHAFLSNVSECEWYGITCNDQREIRWIDLSGNNLDGVIPWENIAFGRFLGAKTLEVLWFHNNDLRGKIDHVDWESFKSLSSLSLGGNQLEGTLPQSLFKAKRNLNALRLNNNNFSGSVPSIISNVRNLAWLLLHENTFSGSLPTDMRKLTNLETLSVYGNDGNVGGISSSFCAIDRIRIWTDCFNVASGECSCCNECWSGPDK